MAQKPSRGGFGIRDVEEKTLGAGNRIRVEGMGQVVHSDS